METLTDRIRIFSLLSRLMQAKSLLSVFIEGGERKFLSLILKISQEDSYFVLDELKPKAGHELFTKKKIGYIAGQHQGISVEFEAELMRAGERDGIAFYVIKFPQSMKYFQRRASVRVPLSASNPISVQLKRTSDQLEVTGELKDISAGGLGIRFKSDLSEKLKANDKVECTFTSPSNPKEQFVFDAEIRMLKHKADSSAPAFIGCKFVDVLKPQQRMIEKIIMQLQREAQKRRSDLD